MAYFYAEKMTYCECIMPRQIGWDIMNQLGCNQIVHFENKTVNYENPFIKSFKRCDQAVNHCTQIQNFVNEVKKDFKLQAPSTYKQALRQFQQDIKKRNLHGHLYMNEIQEEIMNIHSYLIRQKKQLENVRKQLNELITMSALLITVSSSQQLKRISQNRGFQEQSGSVFDYRCAIIRRQDQMLVKRGLFRISRGNAWVQIIQIKVEDVEQLFKKNFDYLHDKLVCIVIFQKGSQNFLANKIRRFLSCIQSLETNTQPQKWRNQLHRIEARVKQITNLEELTTDGIDRYLHKLNQPRGVSSISHLCYLQMYAKKQRQIYKQLACTIVSNNFLHFNIYLPSKQLPLHLQPNEQLPPLILNVKQSTKLPPSKFNTPPVMQIPQAILNTYGVPSYGQFNPAVFYIVTFGFFIGVMFGDVGHMLMAIPLLIAFNANIWAWTIVFWMGYCGLIYNEFFGLNLGLFTSCYQIQNQAQNQRISDCVYPFGVDSIWKVSTNQMQFVNSLKMKLAVVIGVTHMMLGLFVRFLNGFKRRDYLDIIALTIPQTIFMVVTFCYMDYLIIYKWLNQFESSVAPSIIGTMIAAYAGFGDQGRTFFFNNEVAFEKFLQITALLMIPIMLLGKPIYLYCRRAPNYEQPIEDRDELVQEDKLSEGYLSNQFKQISQNLNSNNKNSHQQESLKQIFVHQFIQTIEFVLGSVSNTASYLRLWALSLAHGQLAQVIFDLVLKKMVVGGYSSIFGLIIGFPFFFAVTFGVLICMDSMQCFLHSLRLHWVEFQNKFYAGRGYEFDPFTFKTIKA